MRRYLEKASRAVMHMQRGIDQERRKNSNLRKQLHESDIIIVRNAFGKKSFRRIFIGNLFIAYLAILRSS